MQHALTGLTVSEGIIIGTLMGLLTTIMTQLFTLWVTSEPRQFLLDYDWLMAESRTYSEVDGFLRSREKPPAKPSRTWFLAFGRAVDLAITQEQIHSLASFGASLLRNTQLYENLVSKWDECTDREWRNASKLQAMLNACINARADYPNYDLMLKHLCVMFDARFEHFYSIVRQTYSGSEVHETASQMAIKWAGSLAHLNLLVPFVHNYMMPELWKKKAQLETHSDKLVEIMAQVEPTTEAWQICFNKLKKMPDPAAEHSNACAAT